MSTVLPEGLPLERELRRMALLARLEAVRSAHRGTRLAVSGSRRAPGTGAAPRRAWAASAAR